jgi:hypothetical protein
MKTRLSFRPGRAVALLLAGLFPVLSHAQLALTGTAPVTVTFDDLGTSATTPLPDGFVISNAGATGIAYATTGNTTATTAAAGTSGANALVSNSSGGAYNFGNGATATAPDRAVGFLSTGTYAAPRHLLLAVANNTGTTVADLTVTYDVEKYRDGQRAFDWQFYRSADGTSWTLVSAVTVTYAAGTANTVVNPPAATTRSVALVGLTLAPGATTYLRWSYVGSGGSTNAQALALDNLVLTPTLTSAPVLGLATGAVSGPFCVSATAGQAGVRVPFTATGGLTGMFSAQLSDAAGVFPTSLPQNVIGQGNSSPLTATIPAGTPAGTGYRIRVVHAASGTVGRDNGTDLGVNNPPASNGVTLNPVGPQVVLTTGSGTPLTATASAPSAYAWYFGPSATGPFSTAVPAAASATYTPRGADFPGPGTYYLVTQATSTCGLVVGTSAPVTVAVTAPAPTLTLTPRPVPDFGSVYVGSASPSQAVSVSGTNLTAPVVLTPPPGFELRVGAAAFACCAVTLTPTNGTLAPTTVDVRFVPTGAQAFASGVAVGSSDRPTEAPVPVSGTGVAPVAPATVGSAAPTAVTATTATAGGTVVTDGGGPVTERGVVFGRTPYPTVADSLTVDGAGTGVFTSQLTGLRPGQQYYLRAYATNTEGTVYGELRAFTTPGAPLPVELTAFTAAALPTQAAVRLNWATASEKNSARFEVERSIDGTAFTRLGTVAAAGTSAVPRAYEWLDANIPPAGILYYRLRQVDTDGTAAYWAVRSVTLRERPGGLTLVPNPGQVTRLAGASAGAVVDVFDLVGRLVLTASANATGSTQLVLPTGLASGVYVVRSGAKAVRWVVE